MALAYSLLVVDPEGEHASLGALRGVMVLAVTKLPDPAELPFLYGNGICGLILDLSRLRSGPACPHRVAGGTTPAGAVPS